MEISLADSVRDAMSSSYEKHFLAAKQGKIPLQEGVSAHLAALYGALATRYIAAGIPQYEPHLWSELSPFLLMDEKDSKLALMEYVVYKEIPKEGNKQMLFQLINKAMATLSAANGDLRAMAVAAKFQNGIGWINLLSEDNKVLLESESKKLKTQ